MATIKANYLIFSAPEAKQHFQIKKQLEFENCSFGLARLKILREVRKIAKDKKLRFFNISINDGKNVYLYLQEVKYKAGRIFINTVVSDQYMIPVKYQR